MIDIFGQEIKRTRTPLVIPENSKPYMPSNGTDGEIFMEGNCFKCKKYWGCTILSNSFRVIYDNNGKMKTPKQWVTLEDGNDVCLSFKQRGK